LQAGHTYTTSAGMASQCEHHLMPAKPTTSVGKMPCSIRAVLHMKWQAHLRGRGPTKMERSCTNLPLHDTFWWSCVMQHSFAASLTNTAVTEWAGSLCNMQRALALSSSTSYTFCAGLSRLSRRVSMRPRCDGRRNERSRRLEVSLATHGTKPAGSAAYLPQAALVLPIGQEATHSAW
jgi:hypothetical protein